LKVKEYFKVAYHKGKKGYEDYKKVLKETLEDSIKKHQITSDVEVGTYLSGGVDSSYVASYARPDKSFTVGFDLKGFDETKMAKDLSDIIGIKNYSKYVSGDEFFDILPTIVYHTDEPHANLSTVPLYFLSSIASEQVKVVLSGEGSDEMFGGYNEYYEPMLLRIYTKIPLCIRSLMAKIVKPLPHFPGQNTMILYGKPFYERYIGHGSYMSEEEANLILNDKLKSDETIGDVLKPYYNEVKHESDVTKKMYIDMNFWLPQDILLKADKMSMANSLELRVPLLDIEVFKASETIPTKYLVKDKQTKHIFRSIAYNELPEEWAKRQKLGFPVPFGRWIKEEKYYKIVKEYFNKDYVGKFFDQKYINKVLDDHYHNVKSSSLKLYNIFI
ncbi:MAG: asparagine synthase C-terminal domain-containing protein, partial [Bacilli bacterium]|nr:asparagine synthase C-terminal domain-containing protein [Bacilli bacterium]